MNDEIVRAATFCKERAEDCREKADASRDFGVKQEYLDLERRWQILAEAYDSSNQSKKEEARRCFIRVAGHDLQYSTSDRNVAFRERKSSELVRGSHISRFFPSWFTKSGGNGTNPLLQD